jgi:hypothetical protein
MQNVPILSKLFCKFLKRVNDNMSIFELSFSYAISVFELNLRVRIVDLHFE